MKRLLIVFGVLFSILPINAVTIINKTQKRLRFIGKAGEFVPYTGDLFELFGSTIDRQLYGAYIQPDESCYWDIKEYENQGIEAYINKKKGKESETVKEIECGTIEIDYVTEDARVKASYKFRHLKNNAIISFIEVLGGIEMDIVTETPPENNKI